ncbi:MAG: transglutaminase domain-containing protein [Candidatus Merdivicinus sp.]|jgi:glucan-binding YG repeat protein
MQKWRRFIAALLAASISAAIFSTPVSAKDGYLDRVIDDNQQQLFLLTDKSPNSYCTMITPDSYERSSLKKVALSITSGCSSDEQKTEAIYRWITTNLYYDWDGVNSNQLPGGDPYSAYDSRVAVCEGFATLFAELMNAVNVPCVTFHGASINDPLGIYMDSVSSWNQVQYEEIDHAWNAAYVGGQWLYYDTTWDCANKKINGEFITASPTWKYYAIPADKISSNHRTAYRINDEGSFRLLNNQWIFCNPDGTPYSGIWYDGYRSNLYYMKNGVPLTGRTVVDYQLIDFDENGRYIRTLYDYTGWTLYNGNWYYIHKGIACYGWGFLGGKWYYLDPQTSIMQIGWRQIDGHWYYFNTSGAMQTGWLKYGDYWYYLNSDGSMATGWKKLSDKWYYFSNTGAMATGWRFINGHWYYLYSDGSMAANTVIDGYYLNSSGTY